MTEGNIATWQVKEGDSFSAGDVILEIETDKATMDVEAQDDGILMKVTMPDGSKGVQVGQRIAVFADPGDDISSLEMPADDSSASSGQQTEKVETTASQEKTSESKQETSSQASKSTDRKDSSEKSASSDSKDTKSEQKQGGTPQKQTYPLYPSVEHLLYENGLSEADAENIPATGPAGRLLKGDVLAYLGKINKEYPAQASSRLEKLSHLDLSNIQIAPKQESKSKPAEKAADPELPEQAEIAIPISLSAVIATQKRVQDTLGIFLPLSTFIARASELANDDLPLSKDRKPTQDDLFNAIVGLDQVPRRSRGNFFPQITGISHVPLAAPMPPMKKTDIIDLLAPSKVKKAPKPIVPPTIGVSAGENIFSVVASSGEETQATEYLERMKIALEKEPGRLVL